MRRSRALSRGTSTQSWQGSSAQLESGFISHDKVGGRSFDLLAPSSTITRCLPAELDVHSWKGMPLLLRIPGKICYCGPKLQIKMLHFTFGVLLRVPKETNPSSLVSVCTQWKKLSGQFRQKTDQAEITLVIYCSQTCSSTESHHYNSSKWFW